MGLSALQKSPSVILTLTDLTDANFSGALLTQCQIFHFPLDIRLRSSALLPTRLNLIVAADLEESPSEKVAAPTLSVPAVSKRDQSELDALFRMAEEGDDAKLGTRSHRLKQLLLSENHYVRVQAERMLIELQFGKPRQAVEVKQSATVRYVVEVPPDETREQWRARQEAMRAKVESLDFEDPN
jgi:hypothetical protein